MRLLVVNAGSSSLKLRVLGSDDETLDARDVEWPRHTPFPADALADLPAVDAVAHRIVHGGESFRAAAWIDGDVRVRLEGLADLAPLHQPRALAGIDAVKRDLEGVRSAACFDTGFHATLPPAAALYAVPRGWGVRRFGFHGLSHAYAARRAADTLGRPLGELRIVSCHLGAGASLAAVSAGQSVDTTMGFTPLEGLVMASRSGSVDPGVLLFMLQRRGMTPDRLGEALERESGLAALAGTGDMRELLGRKDDRAREAVDVYLHRLRAGVAAMAAAMNGLDALVFTGGVGEHAPLVRSRAAAGLEFLGVGIDERRNREVTSDEEIGAAHVPVRTLVVTAREDLEMARQVRALA